MQSRQQTEATLLRHERSEKKKQDDGVDRYPLREGAPGAMG